MWFINIGSTNSLLVQVIGQIAQTNLVTFRNSEFMAGSQYPQTTSSFLKLGLLLIIILKLFFFSREKSSYTSEMDQSFPSSPSSSITENEIDNFEINSGLFRKLKSVKFQYSVLYRDTSGFLNPIKELSCC